MLQPSNELDISCDICKISTKNFVLYGDFYVKKTKTGDVRAHHFCLLFSNKIFQRGLQNSGILGFQVIDIRRGIQETISQICVFCNCDSASITCAHESCEKQFHFICGYTHDCLYIFKGHFEAFCSEHHGIEPAEVIHTDEDECFICLQPMGTYNVLRSVTSNCCGNKNWWMHRRCLMDFAVTAGYYLKCIFCLNVNFREDVKRMGVYVPDRDAQWEKVTGAYADLRQNIFCDVKVCYCPKSRKYTNNGKWKLLKCQLCAASGTHKGCAELTSDEYECFQCRSILYSRNIIESLEIDANDDIECVDVSLLEERMTSFLKEIPCIDLVTFSYASDWSVNDLFLEMDAEAALGPVSPIKMPQPIVLPPIEYSFPPSFTQEYQLLQTNNTSEALEELDEL